MTKTSRNTVSASEESFHKHYSAIWGEERWQNSLYPALAEKTRQCAVVNRYAPAAAFDEAMKQAGEEAEQDPEKLAFPGPSSEGGIISYVAPEGGRLPPPSPSAKTLATHWTLDGASALAAHLLNIQPGDNVLDLCAAPGGKSICITQSMWPDLYHDSPARDGSAAAGAKPGRLRSNEIDGPRQKRLTENLKQYLPEQLITSKHVESLRIDCTDPHSYMKLSTGSVTYDKVLVDAPCSSERHIIHAHTAAKASGRIAPEMANWRPGSTKRLQKTQLALLTTALKVAKVGGRIMYATCSLESGENDGVIDKIIAWSEKEVKKGSRWTIQTGFGQDGGELGLEKELEQKWAERTKYGWIALPDHPGGGKWGPLFFTMLTKVAIK